MKKLLVFFCLLLCSLMFTGAVGRDSPVWPSKNFYINDYAGVIAGEYRDSMLQAARELSDETGAQLVVLTVDSLGGREIDDYANRIFGGWNIGGADDNGALILVSTGDSESHILVGQGLSGAFSDEELRDIQEIRMIAHFANGDYSTGIHEGFLAAAGGIYAKYGIDRYGDRRPVKKEKSEVTGSGTAVIIVALFMFIALRGFRIGAKYRKKYGHNNEAYLRKLPRRERIRYSDDDYPSGFGGLGPVNDLDGFDDEESDSVDGPGR